MERENKVSIKAVIKFAGAFVAWVMGSGFATGQEILQFFTSYGYMSYAIVILNFIGFFLMGTILLVTGFKHREDAEFNQLKHFCGDRLGAFYSWLIPLMLIPSMAVLVSGAGATLSEYYGVNHYIGAAIMAAMVLASYLIGFERFVRIVSCIGPVIILFTLIVGVIVIIKDGGRLEDAGRSAKMLSESNTSPSWLISAVLYVSLTFLGGSGYYTALGATGANEREVKIGAIAGVAAIIASIAVINTAILSNAANAAALDIPNLYLARRVSPALGAIFSIMLILGIFSSCSVMMWTVCNKFTKEKTRGNRIFAVCLAAGIFLLGLLSFSNLISVLYPFIGYVGLIYMVRVIYKGIRRGV